MRHVYPCPLRWSDMDAFGHVNNVVFLRYLEEARIDFMFRLARQAASGAFTGGSVVARHEISYLRPLTHRHEPVVVELWVTKVGAASVTVSYEVKDGPGAADGEGAETVYARASTVVVPYDLERERPRRLSDEEKAFLKEYLDDSATGTVAA
ncbi:thioesterase family protein [Streptomyces sp. TRM 70361]|uniref:acyl-CoA thioesterase n=1 Tax=Streptomyces sp. TRM 70361 TaxID=3116553 RepID=UPI002E7B71B9|nr:thioesterase family protein [Streptomyces sp. TRM 70361]MEE1938057.1 thioesterase family protein [Streptomyces sp. TRM 70361]